MVDIILPKTFEDGTPKISYSQIKLWNEKQAFNEVKQIDKLVKVKGYEAYILKYFMDYNFPPSQMDIYAPFGTRVENAICEKDFTGFSQKEIDVLKSVEPIGVFQRELRIQFDGFALTGFIDDCNEDQSHLRDYKTASKSSMKQYEKDDYDQLNVYALDKFLSEDRLPEKMEVCIIERTGSHIKPPLTVGENVWYIDKETSEGRLMFLKAKIESAVRQISECYKVFLQLKGENNGKI